MYLVMCFIDKKLVPIMRSREEFGVDVNKQVEEEQYKAKFH